MNNSQNKEIQIVILAAGKGSRMDSDLPKVMHKIGDHTMLDMVITNSLKVTDDIILVYSDSLLPFLEPYRDICKIVNQENPQGTAHATYTAIDLINKDKIIGVLYGDNPLITSNIIIDLIEHMKSNDCGLTTLAFQRDNPAQYGRIITDSAGNFLSIREFKDANETERAIKLCNSGIMAFAPGIIEKYLPLCLKEDPNLREYYLTKIVEICSSAGEKASYFLSEDDDIVVGVNTAEELANAKNIYFKHNAI